MQSIGRGLLLLISCLATANGAYAVTDHHRFVAPGLWLVTADIVGSMGQRSRLTQEQCWTVQGDSGQSLIPLPRSGQVATQTSTVHTGVHSTTVHLLAQVPMPEGTMTQDITLVFARGGTMKGHGRMTAPATPILDETFTEHGHRLATNCPATLPPAKLVTLSSGQIPAITALQHLARQLKAQSSPQP